MTALPHWVVPGQKIVCVDDGLYDPASEQVYYVGSLDGLTKGTIYTVRAAEIDPLEFVPVVHLVEIVRPTCPSTGVAGYATWRFRPVVTLEEDMLTFRSLLNTVPANPVLETTL